MSLIISKDLPYVDDLKKNNIQIIFKEECEHCEFLRVAILNLMPNKQETELQLLTALGHSVHNVWVDYFYTISYTPIHISKSYLDKFYKPLCKKTLCNYDGLIITGAPVEKLEFDEVLYWEELRDLMNFAFQNLKSTIYICWAAQVALKHFYNIDKKLSDKKFFGVYSHEISSENILTKGLEKSLYAPHSRYSYVDIADIALNGSLNILANSTEVGPYLIASHDYKNIMALGHIEYHKNTLRNEYFRDVSKGINISVPTNYFLNDDPNLEVIDLWSSHKALLFSNWLHNLK